MERRHVWILEAVNSGGRRPLTGYVFRSRKQARKVLRVLTNSAALFPRGVKIVKYTPEGE